MSFRRVLYEKLKENEELSRFFVQVCETSEFYLDSQAWQFRNEVWGDEECDLSDVRRELKILAGDLLPESEVGKLYVEQVERERDRILSNALHYCNERGVEYKPLDVEEDINASYEDDDLETFRDVVWTWCQALAEKEAA